MGLENRKLFELFPNRVFVETGTYEGDGVQTAWNAGFEEIYSIESNLNLVVKATDRFVKNRHVHIILGDSSKMLWDVIKYIHEPATFWLDGHSQGDHPIDVMSAPLLKELEIISRHHIKTHKILIDDRRLFGVEFWKDVTESKVIETLKRINPEYKITFHDSPGYREDIIAAEV